ncbi:MAG: alanine dehydrogenase [Bacteroidetes bacterium]|nr:alanine dehydrogenase [Bacteroidota bacterium]
MVIGILKERFEDEQRVALSPFGVESLVRSGAQVIIETGAGLQARFPDEQYQKAGASIAYSAEEVAGRGDVVMKVMPPLKEEWRRIPDGTLFMSFQLLGMGRKQFIEYVLEKNITTLAYELLRSEDGGYPALRVMSEVSGQVAAQIAGRYLRSDHGGRGVLLGGLGGVAPAAVVILGAGASGMSAAQAILGLGGQVILLDNDLERLRYADQYFNKRVTTVMATPENLRRGCRIADVFIGAISINDRESHQIITEEMVKTMKPGAVAIDISINQGGCIETSRPMTIKDPVFEKYGVIHYCVPNMPSVVARTSTYALTNVLLPYLQALIPGFDPLKSTKPCVRCGVVTWNGKATHSILNDIYGMDVDAFDCCEDQ